MRSSASGAATQGVDGDGELTSSGDAVEEPELEDYDSSEDDDLLGEALDMESAGDCEGVDSASDDDEIGEDPELQEFSKCLSAVRPWKCATLKVMRAWRTSYEDLKATRHLPGRLKISQTTNK